MIEVILLGMTRGSRVGGWKGKEAEGRKGEERGGKGRRVKHENLIFFFLTGLRILMTHRASLTMFMPSNTSLYLPLPTLRTTS